MNVVDCDEITGVVRAKLDSAEYLYGKGKKIIDQSISSAICMFRIANIEEINKISRELGNKVITAVSRHIKQSISEKGGHARRHCLPLLGLYDIYTTIRNLVPVQCLVPTPVLGYLLKNDE